MVLVFLIYLLFVVVLPLAFGALILYRSIAVGRSCPICRGETLRLRLPAVDRLYRGRTGVTIQRRWCPTCGWSGLTRVANPVPRPPTAAEADSGLSETGKIELRELTVDGRPWRVLLRCWHEGDVWYGQLLFTAQTGRMWVDPARPLTGRSPDEILAQAQLLSVSKLTGRLREVVED